MNRYGQISDLLTGDISFSIFLFGLLVSTLVIIFFFLSGKERDNYNKDYYDRHGSPPK